METLNRPIQEVIIHCSATKQGLDYSAADIDLWHRQQGWKSIGYHFVVRLNGDIERGRSLNQVGAHCYGHNACSVGLCYIGGLNAAGVATDTRTKEQKQSLECLIACIKRSFPWVTVHGHNEFVAKDCPSYRVP